MEENSTGLEYDTMEGDFHEGLQSWNHKFDGIAKNDKDSIRYFMTEMTQKEFDEIRGDREIIPYKFNTINFDLECTNAKCRCKERMKCKTTR